MAVVGDGENMATLSTAIGAKEPPKYLLGAAGFGALLLFFGGIATFVGLVTAAGSGYVWFQGKTKASEVRQALTDHFDKIGKWVARLQ
jgi:hypothetical protein